VSYYYLLCRSLTHAQRTVRALSCAGVAASVGRAPYGISDLGCAYSIKLSERTFRLAMGVIHAKNLPYQKIFRTTQLGGYEEVRL